MADKQGNLSGVVQQLSGAAKEGLGKLWLVGPQRVLKFDRGAEAGADKESFFWVTSLIGEKTLWNTYDVCFYVTLNYKSF